MASDHDVAAYILEKLEPMSAMKLQGRLVHHSQAWTLASGDQPLFPEHTEAWPNGSLVRELYSRHRWQSLVAKSKGYASALTPAQRATVDTVLEFYGDKSAQWRSGRLKQFTGRYRRSTNVAMTRGDVSGRVPRCPRCAATSRTRATAPGAIENSGAPPL